MNVLLLEWACVLAVFWNILVAVFVYTRNPGKTPNQVFLLLGLSIAVWNSGTFMMFRVSNPEAALFWARFLSCGVLLIPLALVHLSLLIAEVRWKWAIYGFYAVTFAMEAVNCAGYYISGAIDVGYAFYSRAGLGFWVYTPPYVSFILASIAILIRKRRQLPSFKKRKLDALIVGQTIFVVFGMNDMLPILGIYRYPLLGWKIYPWGTLAAVLYGTIIAYSLLQHQLLDVHVRLGKISAQIVRMTFLSVTVMLLFSIASIFFPEALTEVSIVISLVILLLSILLISLLFPKIIGATGERLERTILGDHFEYHDRLRAFTQSLQLYTNTESVVQDIQGVLINTMRVKNFLLFLADENLGSFFPFRFYPPNPSRPLPMIEEEDPLLMHLERNRLDHLALKREYKATPQGFRFEAFDECPEFDLEFCFPVRSTKKPFGLLFIGGKVDGLPYTAQDVELIGQMTRSAAMVINQIRLTRKVDLQHEQELIGVMSRGLAHDLNNLFTPINTYFQLSQEGRGTTAEDNQDQLFEIAVKNTHTIQAYIKESLMFATTLKPHIAPTSLKAIIEDSHGACQAKLEKKNISLATNLPHSLPLQGDEILLQRLFSNLINNAADASPRDSTIYVTCTVLARTGGRDSWYRASITDTGSGIPRDSLKKVFTPYFTTKDSGEEGRGVGLGLSISRKITEIHEGSIQILSKEGKGTTVEVDLPSRQPVSTTSEAVITHSPQ